ncbi:MAG: aspartyl/glutamyl-tRNA amidotransferase subunit C [Candidatus Gracilibacteria bacterium]
MSLTTEQIKKIAKLAKLPIKSDEEAEKYVKELSPIVDYFTVLQEVDVTDVAPTAQVTGLQNITHLDTPSDRIETFSEDISEKTIKVSQQSKTLMQIKVPNVL